ncbi:unnamed protein product [Sphenostylis stenocarpa]|uniref:Uncharacterized protein n=1 Tax=Sphenostylis stenocarpa TaxID=92480 RepID=A0AA86W2U1_9FABA|nr:unnamed protein product [Sphenostylis stenocarpa]
MGARGNILPLMEGIGGSTTNIKPPKPKSLKIYSLPHYNSDVLLSILTYKHCYDSKIDITLFGDQRMCFLQMAISTGR